MVRGCSLRPDWQHIDAFRLPKVADETTLKPFDINSQSSSSGGRLYEHPEEPEDFTHPASEEGKRKTFDRPVGVHATGSLLCRFVATNSSRTLSPTIAKRGNNDTAMQTGWMISCWLGLSRRDDRYTVRIMPGVLVVCV
ncbi:unnamed protein product [Protopolystoma xenopodis]|uniref:Uncharacterized protein n=1 Tax=Protopolystoma xenopodis TaxID=117903 RepID=A0A3S5BBN7_9PLAT|nr:unnamed protein product [Protopolystoma xenopodis]